MREEQDISSMSALDLGRALMELGREADAASAFALALETPSLTPEEILEAAVCLLSCGGDYHVSFDTLLGLVNGPADGPTGGLGQTDNLGKTNNSGKTDVPGETNNPGQTFRERDIPPALRREALSALTEAFYLPNEADLRRRYEANRALLSNYPYLFRRDFPAFDALPLRFYPFDDGVWVPFDGERFLPRTEPGYEVISRNFFHDLDKPVLASDVYSQYELSYLRDNVRRSEDIGRENHVYLHYTDWNIFCAWMQALDFRPLLREKKLVFLFGEELARYPLDFRAEYGIDYGNYPLKPVGIREVTRLIWHTQLSTHNGGDFFNEIFDSHPNLVCLPSVMLSDVEEAVGMVRRLLRQAGSAAEARRIFRHWENPALAEELYRLKQPTDKDLFVALYLGQKQWNRFRDPAARIDPALFFQPHFPNTAYTIRLGEGADAVLSCPREEELRGSPLFRGFPYIKTFTPLRRFTASFGGAMHYVCGLGRAEAERRGIYEPCPDAIIHRVLNRSFMADPSDRLFRDSVIVRLEDGKLNPRATLSRLAAFLDLPYTESMTYCSEQGVRDPVAPEDPAYAAGFSLASLHRDYSAYVNDREAEFIEYCLRDAYRFYGYGFQYYDGGPMNPARMEALIAGFTTQDRLLREDWDSLSGHAFSVTLERGTVEVGADGDPAERERIWSERLDTFCQFRRAVGRRMLLPLRCVSRTGTPLRMIPLLEPDPDLLENPVYQ